MAKWPFLDVIMGGDIIRDGADDALVVMIAILKRDRKGWRKPLGINL